MAKAATRKPDRPASWGEWHPLDFLWSIPLNTWFPMDYGLRFMVIKLVGRHRRQVWGDGRYDTLAEARREADRRNATTGRTTPTW